MTDTTPEPDQPEPYSLRHDLLTYTAAESCADGMDHLWLGFTRGQWPIQAFGVQSMAEHWAASAPDAGPRRYLVGPIVVPDDIPIYRAHTVPATTELIDPDSPTRY